MKKRYLLFGLLASSFTGRAQQQESVYQKQQLKETEVQALLSYYSQDGNHSAVTGGKGTEQLTVFAAEATITHRPDSVQTMSINIGADVITSASTDNIDYVISSASRSDIRSHLGIGYSRKLGRSGITAGLRTGLSVESDYTSLPVGLSLSYTNADGSTELQLGLQTYFDDLRWGRINKRYWRPVTLVYPIELRYKQWFDTYTRNSYNLSFALYQIVNRRVRVALMPELVYQKGLLSTPFHRVYFDNEISARVENLPMERWKIPIGLQANIFAFRNLIFRAYYRFYWDNFGITAHTFQLEVPVKLSPQLAIAPHLRWYTQTASRYFKPYKEHSSSEVFYTSDYDLSAFNDIKMGLTLRYAPQARMGGHCFFDEAALRYAWYKRSDGLYAHMVTLLLDVKHSRIKTLTSL
ncbi:DUF3570 domain-containing protein [Taibaiella koreensis]|uniref:DUF3570 domain-containing protein n=1 Tax=Taibaiella koreensis TaxID=1268548 RepID=UPI000E59EB3D|nr:DUF3570 domain-containing protein [Taibaiella koreensis]